MGIAMGEGIDIDLNTAFLMTQAMSIQGLLLDFALSLNFGDFISPMVEFNLDANGDMSSYGMFMSLGLRLTAGELDFEAALRLPSSGRGTTADPYVAQPAVVAGLSLTM
jgi:hypothetical protein